MSFPRRSIHLDFHTMPGIDAIGKDFDPVAFARTLKEAQVESVTLFARCNLGFAYYPTAIGIPYPELKRDLLGEMTAACRAEGIAVLAYFNAGLDHEHALRHREWCKLSKEGQVYDHEKMGHFFRKMCLNSGYGDYLYGMIAEVLDRYPVDGIFLDCFHLTPCYGVECLDGMKAAGLDPLDDGEVAQYARIVTEAFRERVVALVHGRDPGLKLCFNGLPFRQQPTHIELEILPLGGSGYDALPWQIRYARTLGKPYLTMTGRFQRGWGDFGGLRPEPSLLFDGCYSIAQGGQCSIGDHLHPHGELAPAVYGMVRRVYEQLRELDRWCDGARPVAEIAVVHPRLNRFPSDYGDHIFSLMGATRMLNELKQPFDICDGLADLSPYHVVILPDDAVVDPELKTKLEAHLERGGVLVASAAAGLDPEGKAFALKDYPVEYQGEEPERPSYFMAASEVGEGIPSMPVAIYQHGVALGVKGEAAVLAEVWGSYFRHGAWDRYHEYLYTPPKEPCGRPALVEGDRVLHFSFPLFRGYFEHAVVPYRRLLENSLHRLYPSPLIRTRGLPSFAQVSLTENREGRMVHLLAYLPELRGRKTQMIEEPMVLRDVEIALRRDNDLGGEAYLAPSGEPLETRVEDGYITVLVPEVTGHGVVVFPWMPSA